MLARESVSVVEWLEYLLHPWTQLRDRPGLRAGERGRGDQLRLDRRRGRVPGHARRRRRTRRRQAVGISGSRGSRAGSASARCPTGARWPQIVGVAVLGGIGFTVSLFVSNLAFDATPALADDAKIGVLTASVIAALAGTAILLVTTRNRARQSEPGT